MSEDSGWKIAVTAFNTIFVLEIGGMAQLTTAYFTAESPQAKVWVFLGTAAAMLLSAGIGILAGAWLGTHLSPRVFHALAGVVMVSLGIWSLRLAAF